MRRYWRTRGGRLGSGQDHSTGSREDDRHEETPENSRIYMVVCAMARGIAKAGRRKECEGQAKA